MGVKYKIYGERNSGNNYLIKLCELNLGIKIETNSYDWMHGLPSKKEDYKYLVTVRNPFSWALSMWDDPHSKEKLNKHFDRFLKQKFEGWENIIHMWNRKYIKYMKLGNESDAILIRFEDLIKDPEKEIKEISIQFNLKIDNFENIENEVRSGGKILNKKYNRRDHYINGLWKTRITLKDMDYMRLKFDERLIKLFDYE